MSIVTKTEDKGVTGTLEGRKLKSSVLVDLSSQIDEVNTTLGFFYSLIEEGLDLQKEQETTKFTRFIQNGLPFCI